MSAARRLERKQRIESRRRVIHTYRKAMSTAATEAVPTPEGHASFRVRDALLHMVIADREELKAKHGWSPGKVLWVFLPDPDDREFFAAVAAEQRRTGRGDALIFETSAKGAPLMMVIDRAEFLRKAEADGTWSESSLAILRAPAPDSDVLVYDGTACGHGAIELLHPLRAAKGGDA